MASRSPTIHHSFWGPFANAAALPLGDPRLETGDTAYAQAEASLYVYDGAAWQPVGGGGGGAVFAGALTVYVDPVNGTDAPGGGTLGAPYASINYAYSQVTSLGNPSNTVYNANVGQFVTEKLIFQLAPGRYNENVLLGFKRGRVQLVGNGVQILGSVTMRAVRADFPAAASKPTRPQTRSSSRACRCSSSMSRPFRARSPRAWPGRTTTASSTSTRTRRT
jgi:hypothetical protein